MATSRFLRQVKCFKSIESCWDFSRFIKKSQHYWGFLRFIKKSQHFFDFWDLSRHLDGQDKLFNSVKIKSLDRDHVRDKSRPPKSTFCLSSCYLSYLLNDLTSAIIYFKAVKMLWWSSTYDEPVSDFWLLNQWFRRWSFCYLSYSFI